MADFIWFLSSVTSRSRSATRLSMPALAIDAAEAAEIERAKAVPARRAYLPTDLTTPVISLSNAAALPGGRNIPGDIPDRGTHG